MNKYIDADALLRAIDEAAPDHIQEVEIPGDTDTIDYLDKGTIAEIISKMPAADAEPVRRWIPCSEKLPEKYTNVIMCRIDTHGNLRVEYGYLGDDGWRTPYGVLPKEAIAWQPLPELPKMDRGSE